jgi:3-dehydroquinate dehydratase-1
MNRFLMDGRPRVVGTLSSLDAPFQGGCDIVEVRLDKTGRPTDWLQRCQAIEQKWVPVLLTIRLRMEGGDWESDDQSRLRVYEQGLAALSAVDVELRSVICGAVAKEAARLGKVCIVSYHDFQGTPPLTELESVADQAQRIGSIAKISTLIRNEADLNILRSLLEKKSEKPLCVIGMGESWRQTRVTFPTLGSCLTYGYLDQPTAPGQWPAAELMRQLQSARAAGV